MLTQTGAALAREGRLAPRRQGKNRTCGLRPQGVHWFLDGTRCARSCAWEGSLSNISKSQRRTKETIRAAFQEVEWPPRIDYPLPLHPDQDPKRRLHDAINTHNRHQKHRLVHFLGDGTGEGVRWELRFAQLDIDESLHATE